VVADYCRHHHCYSRRHHRRHYNRT